MRLLGVIAVLFALAAPSASAVTLVNPDGTPSHFQRWANQQPMPTVKGRVFVALDTTGFCAGSASCELPGFGPDMQPISSREALGTIWYRPHVFIIGEWLGHALGHFYDWQVLTDMDRTRLEPLLGFAPGTPWFGCGWDPARGTVPGCINYRGSPQEYAADAYSNCTIRGWGGHAYINNATQVNEKAICRTLSAIARSRPSEVDRPQPMRHHRHRSTASRKRR